MQKVTPAMMQQVKRLRDINKRNDAHTVRALSRLVDPYETRKRIKLK